MKNYPDGCIAFLLMLNQEQERKKFDILLNGNSDLIVDVNGDKVRAGSLKIVDIMFSGVNVLVIVTPKKVEPLQESSTQIEQKIVIG